MELDNLKSNWKNTGSVKKNQDELLTMTQAKNHPDIKRIRIKLTIETVAIIAFLMVYYDGFDGSEKPLWINAALIATAIAYIIARISGWLVLRNPIAGNDLKKSLSHFNTKLKQAAVLIVVSSFLFGSAVIVFFTSSIEFTKEKYMVLAVILVMLISLVYVSNRIWIKRIKSITKTLSDFG